MADGILEICCFNLESALIAQRAGAGRVELCADAAVGGTTQSLGTIRAARNKLHIALYPIIRPRGGDFLYDDEEFTIMLADVMLCKEIGCDGVVIGMLTPHAMVDKKHCAKLVEMAYPLGVTFHRAFDWTSDPHQALEDIIEIGCERILTSGQRPTAAEGIDLIAELIRQADSRITIMPGSGVRAANISQLAEKTGAVEFHSSARIYRHSAMNHMNARMQESLDHVVADEEEVRHMFSLLPKPVIDSNEDLPDQSDPANIVI
ncbi:MAG TPA: copper homeostasis protein CutC [Puia sp.]|nr:copper homeostasis protein CutC [Puia sp.]